LLTLPQEKDEQSTGSAGSFTRPSGNFTNSSENDSSDEGENNQLPLDTIKQDFEEYVKGYGAKYHTFIASEVKCIDLLCRLRATKASLDTYESIMEWHFQAILPQKFYTSLGNYPEYIGKKKIYKLLLERYNVAGKVSIPLEITLPSTRTVAKLIKNKAEWCIQSLLTDPRITDNDYLFFNNNPFCGPPQYEEIPLGDINTGTAFAATWKKRITRPGKQVLLPVPMYIDAASTGQFSDLPITALKMTLGIFNQKAREKPYFWRTLGYLPKIGDAEKKKSRGKRILLESGHVDMCMAHNDMMDGEGNIAASTTVKAQDYHNMLAVLLEDFVAIQQRGFSWNLKYRGAIYPVEFVVFVPFIKCDTDEADVLTGAYKSRGRGVAQLCRYCLCPTQECDKPLAQYPPKNWEDIQELIDEDDKEQLKGMSQQPIKNACYKLRFGDHNKQGVHGGTPIEMLHAVLLGTFKYVRDIFFEKLGTTSKLTVEIESMANEYGTLFGRQSARDMPKTSFSNGVNSGKKEAKEFVGIFLVIAAVLCSSKGKNLLNSHQYFRQSGVINGWAHLVELMLMWEGWLKRDTIPKSQVQRAKKKFPYIMALIRQIAPRNVGMGWKILKFHVISHMAEDIFRFGVPRNFDTETDEAGHKSSKVAAKVVQKRKATFDQQVAIRLSEVHVLDIAREEILNKMRIVDYFSNNSGQCYSITSEKRASIIGGATYLVQKENDNSWELINCASKKAVKVEADFPRFVAKLIRLTRPFLPTPAVVRTELLQKDIKYRASCDYMGGVWRDWVKIKWESHGTLPNKIWGFVDFSAIDEDNVVICGGMTSIPRGIYAIVESAVEIRPKPGEYKSKLFTYVTKEVASMEDDRVQKLEFYLADVDAFDEPIVVIPNIGGEANGYLLMSPRSKWADDFGKWLEKPFEKIDPFDSDADDSGKSEDDSEESEEETDESEDDSE
jgi:hypothetical protein